jgi:hypothetical protein
MWETHPDGSIVQRGYLAGPFAHDTTQSVTLPIGFPNSFGGANLTVANQTPDINVDMSAQLQTAPGAGAIGAFNLYLSVAGSGTNSTQGVCWTAWGK